MKINNIYKEVLEYVNNKKIDNMCEISTISAQIIYRDFMKKYEQQLSDNYEDLLKILYKWKKGNEITNRN